MSVSLKGQYTNQSKQCGIASSPIQKMDSILSKEHHANLAEKTK